METEMDFTKQIAAAVAAYLRGKGIVFAFDKANNYIMTEFGLEYEEYPMEVVIHLMEDAFVCYCVLPTDIPQEMYNVVAEYLHRINYGLINGNFELDYAEGAVQYKTFGYCPNGTVSEALLEAVIVAPFGIINRYHPGLLALLRHPRTNIALLVEKLES